MTPYPRTRPLAPPAWPRHLACLLLSLLTAVAVWVLLAPTPVAACTLSPPTLSSETRQATHIVVGTVMSATWDVATVQVEEIWKGSGITTTVTIDNHVYQLLRTGCDVARAEGDHVMVGNRLIAFLEPATDGSASWRFLRPFSEALIIVDGTDYDQRFIPAQEYEYAIAVARYERGEPWFLHNNVGYPETTSVATIKQEWLVLARIHDLVTTIHALTKHALGR